MKIIEINIIQFGKFKDEAFTLSGGFNLVRGDNESGKSTLLAFIKFVLYGVGRKNPSIAVGERERAISWNVGIAAGSLTVCDVDGKKYRIERAGREGARGSYTDKARIIDLESGDEVFEGEIPGEHFLGISAQAYDSMCNIRQLETVSVGTDAVKGAIDNLLSSGDESTSIQAALKMLDAERRRLLHTNGRGGLVFDCEASLEKTKNEYKNALAFENECAKNTDELERVEISLSKAREEHRIAQRLCDLHDDVLRLQSFDRLRELFAECERLEKESELLDKNSEVDVNQASYDNLARISGSVDALNRSEAAVRAAEKEYDGAQRALSDIDVTGSAELSSVLDDFGSAKSAASYFATKAKKATRSLVGAILTGVLGIGLIAFALGVAFAMSNPSGAMTVGFIAIVSLIGAYLFFKSFKSASADKAAFVKRLQGSVQAVSTVGIEEALEGFAQARNQIAQRKNALESAKFRLSVAGDNYLSDKGRAEDIIKTFRIFCKEGEECKALLAHSQKMKDYLAKRQDMDNRLRDGRMLYSSLKRELERFNEADIRARITPEIEEKIKSIPYEKLKSERDAALQRTNQLSQYKAGIERNLAASGQKRSANEIFPEIEAEQQRLESLKLRLDAVRLAMETVNAASLELKSDVTPRIRERAQKNLEVVSKGKYSELMLSDDMKLSVFADGATRPIESLSRGSLDAAYFALRLALIETLLADKNPPLYMDEPLSQLDDGRAENVLSLVAEHSKDAQCILFTCQRRDVELAKRITDPCVIEL